jgi:hypothetical protein
VGPGNDAAVLDALTAAMEVRRRRTVLGRADAIRGLGRVVELHAVDMAVCSAWLLDPVWMFRGDRLITRARARACVCAPARARARPASRLRAGGGRPSAVHAHARTRAPVVVR